MVLLEKIRTLNFYDFLRKLKEILLEIQSLVNTDATIPIHIIEEGNFQIPDGGRSRMITLISSSPQTVILPEITKSTGSVYFISNESQSTVNIETNTGLNEIWDSNMLINDKEVIAGSTQRVINDGRNYKML